MSSLSEHDIISFSYFIKTGSARLRLTYEQFNQFLANIKRLNDHAQSRSETLQHAQAIFGADNHDLFVAFKELLTKHGLT